MKHFLFFLFLSLYGIYLQGQEIVVSGKVTGADNGEPLPGVTIIIKGTQKGTVTAPDGSYQIKTNSDATLVFTSLGYKTSEVKVANQNIINIILEPDVIGIDAVVKTALGISKAQKALGYAATIVKSDEIVKTRQNDLLSSVAGKIAGVDINVTSSAPGASTAVIIRGMSSLGGSNQPLYIIDGIPVVSRSYHSNDYLNNYYDFGTGIQMINPDDIESITVLKSTASSGLYGSRAANGVILITTKKGSRGRPIVTINSSYEMSDVLRLPQWQNDFGMGWDGHHTLIENGSWGPKFDGTLRLWGNIYNNSQKVKPFVALPNNVYDFFEYGHKFNNSIEIAGGNENSTYRASVSYLKEDGIVPKDKDYLGRFTGQLHMTQKIGKLNLTGMAIISKNSNGFIPTGQSLSVMDNISQIPRDVSIIGLKDYETDPFDNLDYYFTPYGVINPYYVIDKQIARAEGQKIVSKLELEYNIIDNLNILYRLGYDGNDHEENIFFPRLVLTPGTPNYGEVSEPGYVTFGMTREYELNNDIILSYKKDIGKFGFDVMLGSNIMDTKLHMQSSTSRNLSLPEYNHPSNTSEDKIVDNYIRKKRMYSFFGSYEVNFNKFIYLTISGRKDYSSALPKENNSYFYPQTQLSFIFSELLPQSISKYVSFGKYRFSWGKTGNDAQPYLLDPYFVQSVISNPFGDIEFPLSKKNAFEIGNRLGNKNLVPELRTEIETGLELKFFENRLSLDLSYYNSLSKNQIYQMPIDPATGYTTRTSNIGKIRNKGYEVTLGLIPIKTKELTWQINTTYTKNDEKLESLPPKLGNKINIGGTNRIGLVAVVGQPLGVYEISVPQYTAQGNIIVNKHGLPIAAAEKKLVPKANYDYSVGINNTINYKFLTLSMDVDIRQGGLIYSRTKDVQMFTGNLIETTFNDRRPFVIPNSVVAIDDVDGTMDDDGSAKYDYKENSTPITDNTIVSYWMNGGDKLDEAFLLPRSFVKLRRLSLTIDLPKTFYSKIGISNMSLTFYGNNLLLLTPSENHHIDPESSTFGNDLESRYGEFSVLPPVKVYGMALKIVF